MAYTKLRPKRGTALQWTTANPILAEGELGIEVPDAGVGRGTSNIKVGDGVSEWADLPYALDNVMLEEDVASINESMQALKDAINNDLFIQKTWEKNGITLNASSTAAFGIDISVKGYTPIGVTEFGFFNDSTEGTKNSSWIYTYLYQMLNNKTLYVNFRNLNTGSQAIFGFKATVTYRKNKIG